MHKQELIDNGDYTRFALEDTGYELGLEYRGISYENYGKSRMGYYLARPDGAVLFQGDDYFVPGVCDDGGAATGLLGFLTLKPGDTDEEYFDDYTPEQLDWCQSGDCEELALLVYDWDSGDGGEEYNDDTYITRLFSTYEGGDGNRG